MSDQQINEEFADELSDEALDRDRPTACCNSTSVTFISSQG